MLLTPNKRKTLSPSFVKFVVLFLAQFAKKVLNIICSKMNSSSNFDFAISLRVVTGLTFFSIKTRIGP